MYERMQELTRLVESRKGESATLKAKVMAENRHFTEEEFTNLTKWAEDIRNYSRELEIERNVADSDQILNRTANSQIIRPDIKDEHLDELQAKYPGLPPKDKRFSNIAEQLIAIKNACIPGGRTDPRLVRGAATGSNETIPSDGGFLIQQDFNADIWKRAEEMSELVKRVSKIPVKGNGLKIPYVDETSRASTIWGGITIYRLEEAGTKTPSKPKFGMFEFLLKKLIGVWYSTDELLADAPGLATLINTGFAKGIDLKTESEIVAGVGAGQMSGIIGHAATISVSRVMASHINYEDVVGMWARMYGASKKNAVWLISSATIPDLFQMSFPGLGTPVYLPPGGAANAPYSTIFGKPVLEIESCSNLGTSGDIILCDPSQYAMIEKGAIEVAWTKDLAFLTDETVYRWVLRNDGMPGWSSALTPKNGGSTVSPFVVLE